MSNFATTFKSILKDAWNGVVRPTEKQREALSNFYRNLALGLYGAAAYFIWRDGLAKLFFTAIVLIIATASLIGSLTMLASPKGTPDEPKASQMDRE